MLITNALDDPLIVRECHEIPEKYTGMVIGHRLVAACVIVKRIPYSRKIWLGIKFGNLAVYLHDCRIKIHRIKFYYLYIYTYAGAIPYSILQW